MTDNEVTSAEAFPLYWPDGWPRSTARARSPYKVGFHKARVELERGLNIMNTGGVVLSSNVPLRVDGLPYAGTAEKHYADPGVAIYFTWKGEPWVIACDCWDRVKDNLRAIGLTVDAMRMIERSGATELLKRAFAGFKALPAKGETTTDSAPIKICQPVNSEITQALMLPAISPKAPPRPQIKNVSIRN